MLMLTFAISAFAAPLPHRVVVAGGTHGNEYTGVYVLDRLAQQKDKLKRDYPSLSVEPLLANPVAHKANRRFVDNDLNRMFTEEYLADHTMEGYEPQRAKEIVQLMGKGKGAQSDVHVCIDMHTTTSNMGCTLIVNTWSPITIRAAAYVAQHWEVESEAEVAKAPWIAPLYVLLHDGDTQETSPHLCSVARDGLEIECGPTPQGLVRADVVASTERALRLLLRYFELCAAGTPPEVPQTLEVYVDQGKVSFLEFEGGVREESSLPAGLVARSLQDRDFEPLRKGDPLFERLDGTILPYDGACGEVVYPVFVNEAAYYYHQSGRGIGMTRKMEWQVPVD